MKIVLNIIITGIDIACNLIGDAAKDGLVELAVLYD
jgi:hypothetical protein